MLWGGSGRGQIQFEFGIVGCGVWSGGGAGELGDDAVGDGNEVSDFAGFFGAGEGVGGDFVEVRDGAGSDVFGDRELVAASDGAGIFQFGVHFVHDRLVEGVGFSGQAEGFLEASVFAVAGVDDGVGDEDCGEDGDEDFHNPTNFAAAASFAARSNCAALSAGHPTMSA